MAKHKNRFSCGKCGISEFFEFDQEIYKIEMKKSSTLNLNFTNEK